MQPNASKYMSAPARGTSRRVRDPARFASDNYVLADSMDAVIKPGTIDRQVSDSCALEKAAPRFAPVAALQGVNFDPASHRAPRIEGEDVWAGILLSSFFRPVSGESSDDDMDPTERQEYLSDCQRMLSSLLPSETEAPLVHKQPEWGKQTYTPKSPEKPKLPEGPSPRSQATRFTKQQEVPGSLPGSDNSTSTTGWVAGSVASWAASTASTEDFQAETGIPPACCELQAETEASPSSWPGGYAQAY